VRSRRCDLGRKGPYDAGVAARKEETFARLSSFWAGEAVEHAALVRSQR